MDMLTEPRSASYMAKYRQAASSRHVLYLAPRLYRARSLRTASKLFHGICEQCSFSHASAILLTLVPYAFQPRHPDRRGATHLAGRSHSRAIARPRGTTASRNPTCLNCLAGSRDAP